MTDEDQAGTFGGYTPSGRSSEAHVLHLPTMVSHLILSNISYVARIKSSNIRLMYLGNLCIEILCDTIGNRDLCHRITRSSFEIGVFRCLESRCIRPSETLI